jgi:hypothetical protein
MTRDWGTGPPGPPDDSGPALPREKPGPAEPAAAKRKIRRHRTAGDIWCEGFKFGFCDGLRVACREVDDPVVWLVLNELAERYALAAGDS